MLLVGGCAAGSTDDRVLAPGDDTAGGVSIVLQAEDGVGSDADLERTVAVLRQRIAALGLAEARIARSGDARITLELPGVTDASVIEPAVASTGELTFHPVLGPGEAGAAAPENDPQDLDTTKPSTVLDEYDQPIRIGPAALTGEEVGDAQVETVEQSGTQHFVSIDFEGDGERKWAALTGAAACHPPLDDSRRVAIVLDGEVLSMPQVAEDVQCDVGIQGGSTQITGSFTQEEAEELAVLIKGGALPLRVEVVSRSTFGPAPG